MITRVSDIDIAWEEVGSAKAPTLIFLHGWGGSKRSLHSYATALATDFHCILIDLPGFGSSALPHPEWGMAEYATVIAQCIQTISPHTPLAIVGHSFGGALALQLAYAYPDIAEKLVVCAPSWHRKRKAAPRPHRLSTLLHHVPALRTLVYRLLFPHSDLLRYPQLEANFKRIVTQDLTPLLAHISHPTLIIWGDLDTYVPLTEGTLLSQLLAHAQLKTFPGMGHDLPVKHAPLLIQITHAFLVPKAAV